MKKGLYGLNIAVLLEEGINEVEYHYSCFRLTEAGAHVTVIGNQNLNYRGELFEKLHADVTIDQVDPKDFDGIVIPGGLAPEKLRLNPLIVDFVHNIYDRGKVCAAICHGQQVFISAGILKGKHSVAAWSMVDDLIYSGAIHENDARAVRDGTIVTGRFIHDLPQFYKLVLETFADVEERDLPTNYGKRLQGKKFGILVDDASYDMHVFYSHGRIKEEKGDPIFLGRKENQIVHLGNKTWEWGNQGYTVKVDKALENIGAVNSHDFPYEDELRAIHASDLDGLIIPGGLATWMVRGHPGLKKLIIEMNSANKFISTIGRGPKILLSAGILLDRKITCSLNMCDDLISAGIAYEDKPVVRDGNILSCKDTEYLPEWGRVFMEIMRN